MRDQSNFYQQLPGIWKGRTFIDIFETDSKSQTHILDITVMVTSFETYNFQSLAPRLFNDLEVRENGFTFNEGF